MSNKGIPVEVSSNRNTEAHADKTTLSVGGLIQARELKDLRDGKMKEALDRTHQINRRQHELVMEKLQAAHPEIPDNFVSYSGLVQPQDGWYNQAQAQVEAEHPEFAKERALPSQDYEQAKETSYGFTNTGSDKDDLYVGKEGTLVYSETDPNDVADEILRERHHAEKFVLDRSGNVRADFRELEAMPSREDIEKIVALFRAATKVIDIHQVEVLPAFQGKGIASALLDVAHWDIAAQKRADLAVARVLANNPDGQKMMGLFEKNGYEKLYMPGDNNNIPDYYLLYKSFAKRGRSSAS